MRSLGGRRANDVVLERLRGPDCQAADSLGGRDVAVHLRRGEVADDDIVEAVAAFVGRQQRGGVPAFSAPNVGRAWVPVPAPAGLSTTGDPRMNPPWKALGTPAISVRCPVAGGLPLGLQLTADRGEDARLLQTAVRLHRILNRQPALRAPTNGR